MNGNRILSRGVLPALITVCLVGCRGKSIESYDPQKDVARQAIEKSLSTWKSGKPLATIPGTPAIDTFDTRWRSGTKLKDFSILEEVPEQEHPQFKVQLQFAGKPAETSEFIVIGIDPLLVFRKEDYLKVSGK